MFGYVFFVALLDVGGDPFLLDLLFHRCPASSSMTTRSWFWCRYKEGHAIEHWKETQHCYSLELETQRVWDYVGDNYVHRLIQSKTDGKLVELNNHSEHTDGDCPGFHEALLNSRVESVMFFSVINFRLSIMEVINKVGKMGGLDNGSKQV